jgi:hypothetical protein
MIETTIMAHHFQIQNIIHLQTSQNPISKHEMKTSTQKGTKKTCIKTLQIYKTKKWCVLECQIMKSDLKTHNLKLYPKH